jgi:hypothetical protein
MNQPRASNQVLLHRTNKWVCEPTSQTPTLDEVFMVTQAVFVVDAAIQRAKESKNDN